MLYKLRQRAKDERGFTLIELLVVILIIGILAAIAIPSFINQKGKASDAAAKELAHTAQVAIETCATDNNGTYNVASCQTPASAVWVQQTSNTTANLYAIAGADNSHVWAVGAGGVIDSWDGSSWTVQQSGKSYDLLDIGGSATGTGWAVGTNGTILVTTNGTTWTAQAAPSISGSTTYNLQGVTASSASRAWAVGAGGAIISTSNTGATWTQVTSPTTSTLNDIVATGTTVSTTTPVFAVGAGGAIVVSTNGTIFVSQTSPTTANLNGVAAQGGSVLWSVGQNMTVVYTSTKGTTWTVDPVPSIGLSPASGVSGSTVTVTGSNFVASSALTAKFNGTTVTLGGTTTTSAGGAIAGVTFTVPGSLVAGTTYQVAIADAAGDRSLASFTVNQAPAITSAAATTFTIGAAGAFTATASGYPASTFSETGPLPSGVTMSAAGGLSGTPDPGTAGNYPITITAANGVGSNAAQSFIHTVTTFTIGGIQFVRDAPTRGTYTCAATVFTSVSCTATGTSTTNLTGHLQLFSGSGAYGYPETPVTPNTSGSPITIQSGTVTGGAGTPSPATFTIPVGSADSNSVTLVHAGANPNVWTFTYVLNSTTYTLTVTVS